MSIEKMRVQTRLGLLSVLAFVGLLVLASSILVGIRNSAMASHRLRISHLVESAASMVDYFRQQEAAGKLPRDQAQAQAKAALKAMRFGEEDYFFVYDYQGVMVAHGANPKLEGKSQLGKPDSAGKLFRDEIVRRAQSEGKGYEEYVYPRANNKDPEPKLTYFRSIPEWNWIICSAVYVDDVANEVRAGFWTFGSMAFAILLVVMLLGWRISRSITRQLGGEPDEVISIMDKAAGGDLCCDFSHRVPQGSVLGRLGEMLSGLSRLVGDVGSASARLAGSAEEVAVSSRRISSSSADQSDSAATMAAAMEEMTVAISHIADSAKSTENQTHKAAELAEDGQARAEKAKQVIGEISRTVEQASQHVGGLVKRADEIGSITAVIKEIAAQTNLLALNASIEAARAGEQGRGFAVVADEVRSLAERTAQATVQIETMIKTIQTETHEAVDVMNAAVPQARSGVDMTQAAAEVLGQMREGALESLQQVRDVADSTKEQSLASTSIAQQVERIARMVEEASGSAEKTAQAAAALEALSREMQGMVSRFVVR